MQKGSTLFYPTVPFVQVNGTENLFEYRFGKKVLAHKFCSVCGVGPYIQVAGPPAEKAASLDEDKRAYVRKMQELCPVNVKALDGVDWERLRGNIQKMNSGKDLEPKYEVP